MIMQFNFELIIFLKLLTRIYLRENSNLRRRVVYSTLIYDRVLSENGVIHTHYTFENKLNILPHIITEYLRKGSRL